MNKSTLEDIEVISRFNRNQLNVKRNIPIRPSEMGLLIMVSKQLEPITPSLISDYFHVSKSNVTQLIQAMIDSGHIAKGKTVTDLRSYTVKLTPKGQKLVDTAVEEYLKALDHLRVSLGVQDYNNLISLLKKANDVFTKE